MAQSPQEKVVFRLADKLDNTIIKIPNGHQFPRHEGFVHDLRNELTKLSCYAQLGKQPTEESLKVAVRKTAIAAYGMKPKSRDTRPKPAPRFIER